MDNEEIKKLVESGVFKKGFKIRAIRVYYLDQIMNKNISRTDAMHRTCDKFGIVSSTFYKLMGKK